MKKLASVLICCAVGLALFQSISDQKFRDQPLGSSSQIQKIVYVESGEPTESAEPKESAENNLHSKNRIAPQPPSKVGYPSLMSPHSRPIAICKERIFVVNTPSDTVDVIDAKTNSIVSRIQVGIDPVSIAVRPDQKEIWVSNHVSDSVSVIDNDSSSPTFLQVIATIQDFDRRRKSTRFDEPVGIAFANNQKAYIALSSENQIAVVNAQTKKVVKRLAITSQDPRSIVVRGDRLYVVPFESNNKTQLSGGSEIDGDLVTFNAWDHSIRVNNVLSLGHVVDIVKNPKVPDRDLYVFDTKTDKLITTVDTLGTLLYGMTVDSQGKVYVAQTDARNDINGRSGTKKHTLKELENRAFLNQITTVKFDGDKPKKAEFINLEPLPPNDPAPGQAFATPFAIQVSDDDSTLVVSAASSDKLFTVDTQSGKVLGQVKVDSVPRGIAIESSKSGKPTKAWVLNAVANTVSLVDVTDLKNPKVQSTITLEDPTHPEFKRGRIAFNKGAASSTETFSCASCHPDGHTDQLLWVLKTPIVTGGDQIMPRSTMPLRGLRDTAPFHWDGVPGDPYGGNNSEHIYTSVKPNADIEKPTTTTRHVIDGGLASTMAKAGDKTVNDEGKAGLLSAAERDDMAKFLLNVTFPPAQRRAYDNELTKRAKTGFELFHIKGDAGGTPGGNLCGNCHRMPFWVSTNTPGTGMDAPTWRGAYDRWLILPQGRLNIIDFDFFERIAKQGIPERSLWQFSWGGRRAFDPVWEMVLEGSTGYSGSFARQVTLNKATASEELTGDLLSALEISDSEGAVVLQAEGVITGDSKSETIVLQFDHEFQNGSYVQIDGDRKAYDRDELIEMATAGKFVGTFTARHGANADYDHPQPGLWTVGDIQSQRGQQKFPILYGETRSMKLSGRHIENGASLIVDGRKVEGTIQIGKNDGLSVELEKMPQVGIHFLQIQNREGLFSKDFIFHVAADESAADELRDQMEPGRLRNALGEAVIKGDLKRVTRLIARGAKVNVRRPSDGMTPLSIAAFHGKLKAAQLLLEKGARIGAGNRDGNRPLHLAAFMGRPEMVKFLLEKGARVDQQNERDETALSIVSSSWNEGLGNFYRGIISNSGMDLEISTIKKNRPVVVEILENHSKDEKAQTRQNALGVAIGQGKSAEVKKLLKEGAKINLLREENGMTPLSEAAFHGKLEIANLLIEKGANVTQANRDGNTALHLAAFMCRTKMVSLLLKHGADPEQKNERGDSSIESVSSPWSEPLAGFYNAIITGSNFDSDIDEIQKLRPEIAKQLREHTSSK